MREIGNAKVAINVMKFPQKMKKELKTRLPKEKTQKPL